MKSNRMNHLCSIPVLLLLWSMGLVTVSLQAQEFRKSGTTGYVFLELPVTARSVGMGETGLSLTNAGADGLFINPSLVGFNTRGWSLHMTYSDWYVETRHHALGITYHLPAVGTLGAQVIYFDFGSMKETRTISPGLEGTYVDLGTYSAQAYAAGITFARQLTDKFSFGAAVWGVREEIATYSSSGAVVDLGFVYLTGFRSLRIGTSLKNFGLESSYETENFKMPQQLRLGLSWEILGSLASDTHVTMCAEAVHPNDARERIHTGVEGVFMNTLIVRGGYKYGYDDENLTLGLGLRFHAAGTALRVDTAYFNHDRLGDTLRYSLLMEF